MSSPRSNPPARSPARVAGIAAGTVLAMGFVGTASAHGAGAGEFRAPIPLAYLLGGAGATVALTAILLGVGGALPDRDRAFARINPGTWDRATRAAQIGFLALVVAAIAHGLVGRQVATDNLATVVVWPLWLKGLALVAILAGSPWRALSPWRTTYDWLCRLEGGELRLATLPAWIGAWPALVAFVLVVGIVENLTVLPRQPTATAGLVAAGWAIMVAGGVVFGPDWFRRADPVAVLYRLLGRVAPVAVEGEASRRRLVVRTPWQGAARPVARRTVAAFVVVAVYTVSFDGFVETPEYQRLLFATQEIVGPGPAASVVLYLAGAGAFVAGFWAVARLTGTVGGFERAPLAVAPTLVPIAAAYEVAHTYPYVLRNVGRLPATLDGHALEPLAWLSLPAFWGSQVVLIVLGHVVAVVAAHQVIARRVERRRALAAHAPLVSLMVGYTVLSLWIISRPIVA